jgi:hypothetical protein
MRVKTPIEYTLCAPACNFRNQREARWKNFLTAETPRRREEKRGWERRFFAILYSPSSFSPRLGVSAVKIQAKNPGKDRPFS